jgi:hypothetical protein
VVVGGGSFPKRITPMARSPAWSPMASTHVMPAACWVGVGGHGKFAASVAELPEVVQPVMTDVLGTVCVHVGTPAAGGPTVPILTTLVPDNTPVDEMLVRARGEQLSGMSVPRKRICPCVVSALHCSIEASEPGVKCAPLTTTESPPASPEQIGTDGLESSHVTPDAVEVSDRV